MQRVTVTLDDELVAEVDHFMKQRGYQNRSEAFRDLTRAGLQQVNQESTGGGVCVAALIYVYDHHVRELSKRLAETYHDHHDLSVATQHVHLDHNSCLEVALLRGPVADVRHLAEHVISERGVRHGKLVIVPVEVTEEKHAHGSNEPHAHTHIHVRHSGSS